MLTELVHLWLQLKSKVWQQQLRWTFCLYDYHVDTTILEWHMGAEIVGDELAKNIAKGFTRYDGGRHQIRVDMLNKMC